MTDLNQYLTDERAEVATRALRRPLTPHRAYGYGDFEDAARASLSAVLPDIIKQAKAEALAEGDGYHTHEELYEYRMLYNAHAARGWLAAGIPVVKSWRHSDGALCFGGGWFVVYVTLPSGQVSNHYKAEFWDLFDVPEVDLAPEYDGHTPAEAAARLRVHLRQGAAMTDLDPYLTDEVLEKAAKEEMIERAEIRTLLDAADERDRLVAHAERMAAALDLVLHDAHPVFASTAKWHGGIGGHALTSHCSITQGTPPGDDWADYDMPSKPLREFLAEYPFDLEASKTEMKQELLRDLSPEGGQP